MDPILADIEKYPRRRPFFIGLAVALLITGFALLLIFRPSSSVPVDKSGRAGEPAPEPSAPYVRTSGNDRQALPSTAGRLPASADSCAGTSAIAGSRPPVSNVPENAKPSFHESTTPVMPPPLPESQPMRQENSVSEPAGAKMPGDVNRLIASASESEKVGDLAAARRFYLDLLMVQDVQPDVRNMAEIKLGTINVSLLMTSKSAPGQIIHDIKSGDTLERIARKYGTTSDLLAVANGIKDVRAIQAGKKLRVFTGRFTLTVYRKSHSMVLWMNGEFFKRYGVGIGPGDKTPVGRYLVTSKQKEPTWWKKGEPPIPFGDPRNILGTRWMTLKDEADPEGDTRGLGIHGTADDSSIGKSLSAGCVRMHNCDVEELYVFVPEGTPVTIKD